MKSLLLFLIRLYQSLLSPDKGIFRRRMPTCVFYPTCSEYAEQAIKKHGTIKGSWLSIKRIVRCHPWQKEHIDLIN
ncbi:MAG: membrane protein insertion efficiency factor YidD [Candidatus Parcubacteria bacterium]|nr:membrane protein insertion efficiency factor YidD [Candidatus Parcubacteria bacterium]